MKAKTSTSQPLLQLVARLSLCLSLACPLLPGVGQGQTNKLQPGELESAIAHAASGDVGPRDVVVIANAGAVDAIPALEEQFKRATDDFTKMSIASGLVQLKDPSDTYWNFVVQQVTLVLDSDLPDANFSPSQGKVMNPSPEIQAWADTHKVSLNTAGIYAIRDFPGKILQLGTTGDPRAIPILQRALQSHNYQIVSFAAKGLARIQDKASIPLIIAAVQKAPAGYNSFLAESLVYFEDAQAQSTVDSYVPKEKAKMDREERAHGRGVFGW